MKSTRRNLIEIMWLQCLLYLLMQQNHGTKAGCTWGSWLPWKCSCCGNSNNIPVYRVRAKCCDDTYECVKIRYAALNITDVNDFEEKGKCLNDCGKLFSGHNPHTCVSSKMNLDELTGPSKTKSCNFACVGVWSSTTHLTTPTLPTTSSVTNRKTTPTRSPHSRASGTIKSAAGGSSTVSYKSTSYVDNVVDQATTNSAIVIGVPIGCFLFLLAVIVSGICVYKKFMKSR